ncbi:MAG: formylglycine-generating enzyme family protein [Bacteroidales bacterium]|nr:formylglycine-generating enzyme family protein [Bacteroidales bacterium]
MSKLLKLLLTAIVIVSVDVLCVTDAKNYYVGFTVTPVGGEGYSGDEQGLKTALANAGASDVVYIAKGCKFYLNEQLTVKTRMVGGCNPTGDGSQRTAIGSSSSITDSMTVLDGNSLRHPLRSEKHRVATVNTNGIIENCLIRNGHARGTTNDSNDLNGHGGGVLLNGGKLYNCIIRGNVAMNVQYQSSNKSSGGGVYITSNGGEIVNCVIAFNMDDKGVGIDGVSGEVANSTIAYNTQTPEWVNIPAGIFQHDSNGVGVISLTGPHIYLDSFYIASTECTGGQYACFMAAIDFDGTTTPQLLEIDRDSMVAAKAPVPAAYEGYPSGITVEKYAILAANKTNVTWSLLASKASDTTTLRYGGCLTSESDRVWFPLADRTGTTTCGTEARRRDNYPVSFVTWYGGLAYSLWLGSCLPTEAQWEYAARQDAGGTNNSYLYAGSTTLNDVAWHSANSGLSGNSINVMAHEVAKKNSTSKGLHDMSGNVDEWCLDTYVSPYIFSAGKKELTVGTWLVSGNENNTGATSGSPIYNPVAYTSSQTVYRVFRGGNYHKPASMSQLGYRSFYQITVLAQGCGFRSVCYP